MYLPLVGNGAHSSEHGEQSSFAGVWSPIMRSMFPPLVGRKSFLRCKKLIWTDIVSLVHDSSIHTSSVSLLTVPGHKEDEICSTSSSYTG